MSPRVLLCPGHGVREPGRAWDPGATHGALTEREECGDVAERARGLLDKRGLVAEVYDGPGYAAEHQHAVARLDQQKASALYCSIHANIGGGRYPLVRPDYRSTSGARAALAIAEALDALPELTGARTDPLYPDSFAAARAGRKPDATDSYAWWTRGWVCIDGMWTSKRACGVLVELGFLDAVAHAPLWTDEGRGRLAGALAEGIARYLA